MNRSVSRALPVLFGFFVMGFCDVVGIATSYVKHDFGLNETVAGFIPSMVFVWFLLLAVPAAMAMNRIGRKKMVQASNLITVVGMMIPFVEYNLATCMTAFVLLGIGNTMLQVSLNPLLTNVVKGDALTSSLTAGQVVKAVSSFCGPFIAAFAANRLGDWQYLFPIFAAVTLLSALWLLATPIVEQPAAAEASSVKAAVGLLRDPRIRMLFFGIFFIVGVDVGINTVAPKLLIERAGFAVDAAGYGSSVYFVCRTIGAFVGSILLVKMDDAKYFRLHIAAALAALVALACAEGTAAMLAMVGAIGFFCSSIFSVIYSAAMQRLPEKANEISGLMIMGVCGGAVIPPAMGAMADAAGSQIGSLAVIGGCMLYLVVCALRLGRR
ncbi:MFS transporter [uncultured Alistipes sp.]|uniref:MFS transporter n=1 Tax=uncultured Alistipes sp. TaxID=538949 RepID=UPI0026243F01|nr:MFS transporter [uncultured Alistipes sp.]